MCFAALLPVAAAGAGATAAGATAAGIATVGAAAPFYLGSAPIALGSIGAATAAAAPAAFAAPAAAAAAGGFGLSQIGQIFSVASKVMGAFSGQRQQNQAYEYQARIAQRNAELARFYADQERQTGDAEASKYALQVRELISRQTRGFAASGVLPFEGSPLDIQTETAQFGSSDVRTIRANAERKARAHELRAEGFADEAALSLSQVTSPILGAATTLLEAGLPVAAKWYRTSSRAFDPMV